MYLRNFYTNFNYAVKLENQFILDLFLTLDNIDRYLSTVRLDLSSDLTFMQMQQRSKKSLKKRRDRIVPSICEDLQGSNYSIRPKQR